jgi:hypothetical protein
MIKKLGEREKRTLKIGAAAVVAILVIMFGTRWLDHWSEMRNSLASMRAKLKRISLDEAQQANLLSIVPKFEMPQAEEKQELLFRDKLNEQLKKVGIRSEPLQALPSKERQGGYKLLRLKCSAKCQFGQVLDLLAELKNNPYLVSIEEIRIKGGTSARQQQGGARSDGQRQQRQEVELNLTVSTFAK